MRTKKHPLEEAEINLTPLIDVVFVILIMFIVVAPLLEIEKIQLADGPPLNTDHTLLSEKPSELVIHVFADDSITVNKQPISLSQLKEVLVMAHKHKPHVQPQLFQDRNAKFGTYQTVKNTVEAAGFSEIDLVLKPE